MAEGQTLERAGVALADRPVVTQNKMWSASREELERRWAVVRNYLKENGLQAMVIQGYEEKIGGNVRWLTDVPPGYPRAIVFHADDLMTVIDHGPQGETRRVEDNDPKRPGVGEIKTNWALFGGHFTHGLMADSVVEVLKERGYTDVALVGASAWPHGLTEGIKGALEGQVKFSDATEFFDTAKAEKSEEELQLIRRTAALQDEVFAKLLKWIEPGVRDFEVNAYIDYQMQLLGADRGVYIGISAPTDQMAVFGYRHFQGRTMQQGDHMNVLIESNGPGGLWTEVGRMISFGKVSQETQDAHAVCVEGQALTAKKCVPGADPAQIFAEFNDFMVKHGGAPEKRLHSHGQGYCAVERPFIRADEIMKLPKNVNLANHPSMAVGNAFATLCDNIIVANSEGAEFIHSTPKKIFEL